MPETQDPNNPLPQVDNSASIEAEARLAGWRPKDEFRGDPAIWVDAKRFMERGKELAPHLARQAGELRRENETLRTQMTSNQQRYDQEMADLRQQVTGLTEFRRSLDQQERQRIREEALAEYEAARSANDPTRERRALERLTAPPPPPAPAPPPVAIPPPSAPSRTQIPQEMTDWVQSNEWYQRDPVMQNAMNIVGAELRSSGQLAGLTLSQQLDATAKIVLRRYAPVPINAGPRVEGGGRPGQGGGSPSNSPSTAGTYDALPAHIKAECDAQGPRLGLIGERKTFKDLNAWRNHYATQYFRANPDSGYDYRPPGN